MGVRDRELLLDVRDEPGRPQQRRDLHEHLVLAQRRRGHRAPLREEARRQARRIDAGRAHLSQTGRRMPRGVLWRADDGRQRSLPREPDDREGRPDSRRTEIDMAYGPAPKDHQVVYTTLHFEQPWTLENYLKVDGW